MNGRSTILVVDDTPESLRVLTEALQQEGYSVRPANSGQLALDSIAAYPPDLILLDIRMPGLDGFEVCRRLKGEETTRNIPVIFQSAATDLADRLEGLRLGAVDYISKPFQREELLARVNTHLELARLHGNLEVVVKERTAQLELEIAERKRVEDALRANTTFLNTLLNSLPIPVFYKDRDGCYIGFNTAYEEFIGKTREQLLGKSVFDIAPPDLAEIYHAKDLELLRDQDMQVYESQVRDMQGVVHDVIFHKATFADNGGAVAGLIGAILDITEQKRDQEALHLQTVELEQEVAERQMAQEALQEQANLLEEEVEKRQEAQEELEVLNESLEQRVQERTAELSEKNAEVLQSYEDLKKVQGQLLQQDKMASVGQLAAGVAHEINNPMGFIISNLGSLGKYVEKLTAYLEVDKKALAGSDPEIIAMAVTERQKNKIDHICKDMPDLIAESSDGAQRVRQIVQDLKSFSRMDSAVFANADINEGVETTLSIAWNELKYKTTVIKEFGQLPKVWCNMGQLNQVFLNILVNAAHAIKEQGEIRIETRAEEDAVIIAISDTGSGIQPENVKRIFDPFFTTKEVGKGTGLGLAIAYDIITNKHNGRIEVQSEVGKGSTFTIELPVRREPE
jgi:PAS domain S-box-containing protein